MENRVTEFTFNPDIDIPDEISGYIEDKLHEELVKRGLDDAEVVTYSTKVIATVTVKLRSK